MSEPYRVLPIIVNEKVGRKLIGEWLYWQQQYEWSKYKWTEKGKAKAKAKAKEEKDKVMVELAPWLDEHYAEFKDRIVNVGEFGSSRKMYRCIYIRRDMEEGEENGQA